jgi:YD repeat-containing protein
VATRMYHPSLRSAVITVDADSLPRMLKWGWIALASGEQPPAQPGGGGVDGPTIEEIVTSPTLRAAYVPADPVLSDFVYDGSGNLTSYKEDGVTITLTYNGDGTVATQKRGSGPTRTFAYSGGNLAGVA